MALIRCEQCGRQVSDQAAACPNCGNPISSRLIHGGQGPVYVVPEQTTIGQHIGRSIKAIIGWLIGVVVVLFIIGFMKGCFSAITDDNSQKQTKDAPPPPPSALFNVSASSSTEECTELGDYCIRVFCTYYNKGDGPGKKDIGAQLMDNGSLVVTKASTLTLLPDGSQKVYFDFKEAEMGDEHKYTYQCLVDN